MHPAQTGSSATVASCSSLQCDLTLLRTVSHSRTLSTQIEVHPYLQRPLLTKVCNERGILVQAFTPLLRGTRMHDPALLAIAARVGKSPAQVLLRWSLQQGFVPLPKSGNPARIAENAAVFDFELDGDAMAALGALEARYHASKTAGSFGQLEPY